MTTGLRVVAHGGVGANAEDSDGPVRAVERVLAGIASGLDPLDAAVAGAVVLEDDPRFNAGTGSSYRFDGVTIEMDAGVMDDTGRIGAVAAIQRVANPVLVARRVADTPHILLAGPAAGRFARVRGFADHDPATPRARTKYEEVLARLRAGTKDRWKDVDLASIWNFDVPYASLDPTGTVGVVVGAAGRAAVAVSTGGASPMLAGRVGDSPLPGAGFWAGPAGAVTATGIREEIARRLLSKWVHDRIESGLPPAEACAEGIARIPSGTPIGLVAVTPEDWAAAATRDMPWAAWDGAAIRTAR